ncbi:MAG: FKBP-type peptidyl-prolyl cis-trans isomerase [Candidatus Krumholzibacteria bacterium]|nr:FKBP-type peptidyl-prolyl cis-trans isomerase [Candidatus Krumholzibacteria bacterium]
MREARNGDKVKVHYTGRFPDDQVFDSSEGKEPLAFTVGDKQVIGGFDSAVMGMKLGEKKTVTIEASDAYGSRQDHLIVEVERASIPAEIDLKEGVQLEMIRDDNEKMIVTVVGLTDELVTLDANHPMAGRDLVFDLELVDLS